MLSYLSLFVGHNDLAFFLLYQDYKYYSLYTYHNLPYNANFMCMKVHLYNMRISCKMAIWSPRPKNIKSFKMVTADHKAKHRTLFTCIISFSLQFKIFKDRCFWWLLVILIIHKFALNFKIYKRTYNKIKKLPWPKPSVVLLFRNYYLQQSLVEDVPFT